MEEATIDASIVFGHTYTRGKDLDKEWEMGIDAPVIFGHNAMRWKDCDREREMEGKLRASELIERLRQIIERHGDLPVYAAVDYGWVRGVVHDPRKDRIWLIEESEDE